MEVLPTPEPFTTVRLVFRSRSIKSARVLTTTTAFLDVAVEMELCKACTLSSIRLLDRIWDNSLPETEPSPADLGPGNGGSWSRRNYLRTDRHYHRFQFRRAIVEAVKLEDAKDAQRMVEWLWHKFHGCIVPAPAVHMAAGQGRLSILKFFRKNEIPPRRDRGRAMRDEIEADEGHVVRWGRRDLVHAANNKQYKVVWWLYKNVQAPRAMKSVLINAVHKGDLVLIEWLRDKYRTRGFDINSEAEEYELEEKDAVRVVEPPRKSVFGRVGDLSGENVGELLRGDPEEFMQFAALGGQLEVMEWMVENGYVSNWCFLAARPAVDSNRMDMVKFLIKKKLLEAGRALKWAAEACKLKMARELHRLYWAKLLHRTIIQCENLSRKTTMTGSGSRQKRC